MTPLALLPLLLASALAAGSAQITADEKLIADDIRFAENLGRHRWFGLADEVLQDIKGRHLGDGLKGDVALAEARLHKRAAEQTADPEKRLDRLTRGIDLLSDWATDGSPWVYHPRRPDALSDLAALLQARGQLRAQETARQEADRAEALRSLAGSDFEQADAVLTRLEREYSDRAAQARDEERADDAASLAEQAGFTMYQRGLNSLEWAEVSGERTHRLERAMSFFDDYLWAQEEDRFAQYFALHYLGVANRRLGQLDEALSLHEDVLDKGRWWWDEFSGDPSQVAFVTELFDRSWHAKALVQLEMGDTDAALATMDTLLSEHEAKKRDISRAGFQALLEWAGTLGDLGRGARAAEIVKLVADRAAQLPEGAVANDRLATLATEGGGLEGSPGVLMAAARGLFDRREYGEAAFQYLRAASAARSDADKREHTLAAWTGAARSLKQQRRYLEAALAYEQALDTAIAQGAGPDTIADAAGGFADTVDRRYKETRDPFDKTLRDRVSDRLTSLGVVGDLPYTQAKEKFDTAMLSAPPDAALLAEAREQFASVAETSTNRELAQVFMARCLAAEGRSAEALAQFDAVLGRTSDPTLVPAGVEARDKREGAAAAAHNYKAVLLLELKQADEALKLLAGFETKLPRQTSFIESVKALRVRAHTQRGDLAAAEQAFGDLREAYPSSSHARSVAFDLAQAMHSSAAPDDRDLQARAAEMLWTYNELSGFSSFANLRSNAEWFAAAGRHERAAQTFQKALDVYARPGSDVPADRLDEARIGLGSAWTELKQFGRARPYWQDLAARHPNRPDVQSGAARCFGGWLEPQPDGSVVEVQGSGDYKDGFDIWAEVYKSSRMLEGQRIWWESKLGAIYTLYRLGEQDPQKAKEARSLLNNLMVLKPDLDEATIGSLPPEQRYSPLFKPLFVYLDKKLPR